MRMNVYGIGLYIYYVKRLRCVICYNQSLHRCIPIHILESCQVESFGIYATIIRGSGYMQAVAASVSSIRLLGVR